MHYHLQNLITEETNLVALPIPWGHLEHFQELFQNLLSKISFGESFE